jgi:hypothetical protein
MATTSVFLPKTVNGLLEQALVDIITSSSKYLIRLSGVLSKVLRTLLESGDLLTSGVEFTPATKAHGAIDENHEPSSLGHPNGDHVDPRIIIAAVSRYDRILASSYPLCDCVHYCATAPRRYQLSFVTPTRPCQSQPCPRRLFVCLLAIARFRTYSLTYNLTTLLSSLASPFSPTKSSGSHAEICRQLRASTR